MESLFHQRKISVTLQTLEVNQQIYTISIDNEIPIAERNWAVIKGRVIDEITTESPKTQITLKTEIPELIPKVKSDGLIGLIGRPMRIFPQLSIQNYPINMTITATGYIPLNYEAHIGPIINFPNSFNSLDISGNLSLHRKPVVICGRVIADNGTTISPIVGISVDCCDSSIRGQAKTTIIIIRKAICMPQRPPSQDGAAGNSVIFLTL